MIRIGNGWLGRGRSTRTQCRINTNVGHSDVSLELEIVWRILNYRRMAKQFDLRREVEEWFPLLGSA